MSKKARKCCVFCQFWLVGSVFHIDLGKWLLQIWLLGEEPKGTWRVEIAFWSHVFSGQTVSNDFPTIIRIILHKINKERHPKKTILQQNSSDPRLTLIQKCKYFPKYLGKRDARELVLRNCFSCFLSFSSYFDLLLFLDLFPLLVYHHSLSPF